MAADPGDKSLIADRRDDQFISSARNARQHKRAVSFRNSPFGGAVEEDTNTRQWLATGGIRNHPGKGVTSLAKGLDGR